MFSNFYYQPRPATRRPISYNPYDPYGDLYARQSYAARRAAIQEEAYRRAAASDDDEEEGELWYRRPTQRGYAYRGRGPEVVHVPDTRVREGRMSGGAQEEGTASRAEGAVVSHASQYGEEKTRVREQSSSRTVSPTRDAPTPQLLEPVPAVTFGDPTPGQLEAAEKIAAFYLTSKALSKIQSLRNRFLEHKEKFKLPSTIDYHHNGTVVSVQVAVPPNTPLAAGDDSNATRLAYTKNNAPIHAYQEEMSRVLVQLDSVDSRGEKKVREARRNVVREVEEEAAGLEAAWRGVWDGYWKEISADNEE